VRRARRHAVLPAARGDFDIVVAMYHDQVMARSGPGLAGVNITVGLPMVRTSVTTDGLDIAGKGIADEGSLIEALRQAAELAPLDSPQL
jgi:4-hydroxythreonine-4-phosphate dehydrogenase